MSTNTDYVCRLAEQKRALDMDERRHIYSEGIAYAIVLLVCATTFGLAVFEVSL